MLQQVDDNISMVEKTFIREGASQGEFFLGKHKRITLFNKSFNLLQEPCLYIYEIM